jgi:hypothetical protein
VSTPPQPTPDDLARDLEADYEELEKGGVHDWDSPFYHQKGWPAAIRRALAAEA